MKTSTFIWLLVAVLVIAGGLAAIYFGRQAQTQVGQGTTPCPVTSNDSDGDCVTNQNDFYPFDGDR